MIAGMNPLAFAFGAALLILPQTLEKPARSVVDPGLVTTRQAITPAGVQTVFVGRVHGIAFGQTSSEVWVLTKGQGTSSSAQPGQILRLDWSSNRVVERYSMPETPGLQGLQFDKVTNTPFVSAIATGRSDPQVRLLTLDHARLSAVG